MDEPAKVPAPSEKMQMAASGKALHGVNAQNPWPGLEAFREPDAPFFYGREDEAETLWRRVDRQRLAVLIGLSGLGKTSLIQAGLFPRARAEGLLPISIRLDVSENTPELADQVWHRLFEEAAAVGVEPPAHRQGESLWEYFHRQGCEFWSARNRLLLPLLVLDQFEEIFTIGRANERNAAKVERFMIELGDLIEGRAPEVLKSRLDQNPDSAADYSFQRHPYKILLSLREDYLADLEGLRGRIPSVLHNCLRLRSMNGAQALRVVTVPGAKLVEPDAAVRIVHLVAGKGHLTHEVAAAESVVAEFEIDPALLSIVCRELNNRRQEAHAERITAQLVSTAHAEVLDQFYERCIAEVSDEVRDLVEERLLTPTGHRDSLALDRALSMPGVSADAIRRLVALRLLHMEERGGVPRLELTHDVLTGVVQASRDRRVEGRALLEAEVARQKAEDARLAAEAETRRARRSALVFRLVAVMAVVCAVLAVWGLALTRRINEQVRRSLASADVTRAVSLVDNNRRTEALAYLARAVRHDPENLAARSWVVDLLIRRSWPVMTVGMRHPRAVNDAAFSPDGHSIVTVSADSTVRIWDAESGRPVHEPIKLACSPDWIALSPDGERVLSEVSWGEARIWSISSGPFAGIPLRHHGRVNVSSFSPDGRRVVTASFDSTAQVWDAQTGQRMGPPLRHADRVLCARFSPNGNLVITTCADGNAIVWDLAKGGTRGLLMQHSGSITSAEFSPDGSFIVTASMDGEARVWDVATGETAHTLTHGSKWVCTAAFSHDGKRIITTSEDGTARIWDVDAEKEVREPLRHQALVSGGRFSADDRCVLTCSEDGTARVWDITRSAATPTTLPHEQWIRAAAFSPDGEEVLTASNDATARLWDAASGAATGIVLNHRDRVNAAAFSSDGRRVATASDDGTASIWDAATGKAVGRPFAYFASVKDVCFTPDGSRVIVVSGTAQSSDGIARVWDPASGRMIGEPLECKNAINRVAMSRDGRLIATASNDSTAWIWDCATGTAVGEPLRHFGYVYDVAFSPDGRRIATASVDRTVQIWDVSTHQPLLSRPIQHRSWVWRVVFSSDGRRILTASGDCTARVWNAVTGVPIGEPMSHGEAVYDAEFSPDGKRVVTASWDDSARLWDAETGRALGEPFSHGYADVELAMFSPEGRRIVTVSDDDSARVWDAPVIESRDAAAIASLAETAGGMLVDETGTVVALDDAADRVRLLRQRADQVGSTGSDADRVLHWFFADPQTRAPSPLSERPADTDRPDTLRNAPSTEAQQSMPLAEVGTPTVPGAAHSIEVDTTKLSPLERLTFDRFGVKGLEIYNLIDGVKNGEQILDETGVTDTFLVKVLTWMDQEGIIKLEKPSAVNEEPEAKEEPPIWHADLKEDHDALWDTLVLRQTSDPRVRALSRAGRVAYEISGWKGVRVYQKMLSKGIEEGTPEWADMELQVILFDLEKVGLVTKE